MLALFRRGIAVVLLFSVITGTPVLFAQTADFDDASLVASTEMPAPFSSVTLNFSSNRINLRAYRILWTVNGKQIQSGIGELSITIKTRGTGTCEQVIASAVINPTLTITKNIALCPSRVTMLWEAVDSFVPPFYEGKRLTTQGGSVRVIAIPDTKYDPNALLYTWKRSNVFIPNVSGYGKSSAIVKSTYFDKNIPVTVLISSPDGSYKAEGSITVPIHEPEVLISGLSNSNETSYERLDGTLLASGETIFIQVLPYFFTSRDGIKNLVYSWTLNGESVIYDENNGNPNLLAISRSGPRAITLGLIVQNTRSIIQKITDTKSIRFEK